MTSIDQTLLDLLGLDALLPEEQEQVLGDVGSLIFEGTLVRLLEQMDETTRDEFNALMESDAPEDQVMDFFKTKVPGTDAAIAEAIEELRSDILAASGPAPA